MHFVSLARSLVVGIAVVAAAAFPAYAQDAKAVSIEGAYARALMGRVPNGAAYLTLKSARDDRLTDAASDVAEKVELHTHIQEGNVMRMRKVDAVELPAGKPVRMAPGGLHVMLIGLNRKLKPGDTFDLTLTFERAGKVPVKVEVQNPSGGRGKKK